MKPSPFYIPPDIEAAHAEWKANCGPIAVAALMGKPVQDVRPLFPHFPRRNYTNLRHMESALLSTGRPLLAKCCTWPNHGAALVQLSHKGLPYSMRSSHWVAVKQLPNDPAKYVFCDVIGGRSFGWVIWGAWHQAFGRAAALHLNAQPDAAGRMYRLHYSIGFA